MKVNCGIEGGGVDRVSGYSLKAACSGCGRYGTIDDMTLICVNCGAAHEMTAAERAQRDLDIWQAAMARRTGVWPPRFLHRVSKR